MPVATCSRTPGSVASSGSTACVAAEVHSSITPASCSAPQRADQVAAAALVVVGRPLVVARRAPQRRGGLRVIARAAPGPRRRSGGIRARTSRMKAGSARRAPAARAGPPAPASRSRSPRSVRRARPRRSQQRRSAAGRRSRSPRTATPRRTARCRSPRRTACGSGAGSRARRDRRPGAHGRHTARKSSARSSSPVPDREVALVDRRHEPVVERPREAAAPGGRGPSRAAAPSRARELARVEDARAGRRAPNAGLEHGAGTPPASYSRTCQGLPDRLAPGGASVRRFGVRDVRDAAGREQRREALQQRQRLLDVLDGLQEHDRVVGSARRRSPRSAQRSNEVRDACTAAARARGPRGLASTPTTSARVLGEHGRAVALAARHVDHPQAGAALRRSTGTRPDDGDTSSSPPGRREASARRSARAAARRVAGLAVRSSARHRRLPRRHDILRAPVADRPPAIDRTTASARSTPATTTRRPRRYDCKWAHRLRRDRRGPGAGEAAQGARRASPATSARALEIGAGTGYFSLNLLRCRRGRPGDRHGHLARHAAPAGGDRERPRPRGRDRARSTPSSCRSPTRRSISSRPCGPAPPSRARPGDVGVPPRAAFRAARSHSWESRPATATGWRSCRSGSADSSSPRGAGP